MKTVGSVESVKSVGSVESVKTVGSVESVKTVGSVRLCLSVEVWPSPCLYVGKHRYL